MPTCALILIHIVGFQTITIRKIEKNAIHLTIYKHNFFREFFVTFSCISNIKQLLCINFALLGNFLLIFKLNPYHMESPSVDVIIK